MTMLSLKPRLFPQELRVLDCMWNGMQRKEIAVTLSLSDTTVKNYIHTLYAKLNAKTGTQAIRRALEWGFLRVETYKEDQ